MVETLGATQVCSSMNMLKSFSFVGVVRWVIGDFVIQCSAPEILISCKELGHGLKNPARNLCWLIFCSNFESNKVIVLHLQTTWSIVIKQVLLFISAASTSSCLCCKAWFNLYWSQTWLLCCMGEVSFMFCRDLLAFTSWLHSVRKQETQFPNPASSAPHCQDHVSSTLNFLMCPAFLILPCAKAAVGKKWKTEQTLWP